MYLENYSISPSVIFWDRYAKWYDLWIKHNSFHNQVLDLIYKIVEPKYKVLDIGAGNGVLALPLCSLGCDVTVIEPSNKMRELLFQEAIKKEIQIYNIDPRMWEDIPVLTYRDFDLVIACNCLHLMDMSFEMAFNKIFLTHPKYILVVSELKYMKEKIRNVPKNYELKLLRVFYADTSFAYHSLKEAYEHYEFKMTRPLNDVERYIVYKKLIYKDEHFWSKSEDLIGIYLWHRKSY
jgi:2-polyprenyl-3-methyl-5-hydroxy-6-metoxy-1,4-benzoquinol methylase